jgi:hypothetical protein
MTLTAPWQPAAETAIRATIRTYAQVWARKSGHADTVLPVTAASVTFDETWVPHVQADVTCAVPDDALLDLLDPRDPSVRLLLDAGYYLPSGLDVHNVANLGLRERNPTRPDNTMRLTAESDEALVLDAGPVLGPATTATDTDLSALVATWLRVPLGYVPQLDVSLPASKVSTTFDNRNDWWPLFKGWTDAAHAWLYDGGDRVWHLSQRPTATAQPAHTLKTGPGGTVEASSSTLSQADWANYVSLLHSWSDAGVDHTVVGVAYVTSGPHQAVSAGKTLPGLRVYSERNNTPIDQASADAAAAAILVRRLRAGAEVTLTAVAAWWLRPGMTVALQIAGAEEFQLVTRVTFDLLAGRMTLTTRLPDLSTIKIGA